MNLWGAADRQPVCTACPAGALGFRVCSRNPDWKRSVRAGQESL